MTDGKELAGAISKFKSLISYYDEPLLVFKESDKHTPEFGYIKDHKELEDGNYKFIFASFDTDKERTIEKITGTMKFTTFWFKIDDHHERFCKELKAGEKVDVRSPVDKKWYTGTVSKLDTILGDAMITISLSEGHSSVNVWTYSHSLLPAGTMVPSKD